MNKPNQKHNRAKKGERTVVGSICVVIALVIAGALLVLAGNRARVVGRDIAAADITEFFYTRSSSVNPPEYQRYRFRVEDGTYTFYHEKREGAHWPLTESDITVSGTVELSGKEWTEFMECLNGGTVKKRGESAEAGGSGPWLYLYWKGDRAKYQEFSFSSLEAKRSFEEFCAELVMLHGK